MALFQTYMFEWSVNQNVSRSGNFSSGEFILAYGNKESIWEMFFEKISRRKTAVILKEKSGIGLIDGKCIYSSVLQFLFKENQYSLSNLNYEKSNDSNTFIFEHLRSNIFELTDGNSKEFKVIFMFNLIVNRNNIIHIQKDTRYINPTLIPSTIYLEWTITKQKSRLNKLSSGNISFMYGNKETVWIMSLKKINKNEIEFSLTHNGEINLNDKPIVSTVLQIENNSKILHLQTNIMYNQNIDSKTFIFENIEQPISQLSCGYTKDFKIKFMFNISTNMRINSIQSLSSGSMDQFTMSIDSPTEPLDISCTSTQQLTSTRSSLTTSNSTDQLTMPIESSTAPPDINTKLTSNLTTITGNHIERTMNSSASSIYNSVDPSPQINKLLQDFNKILSTGIFSDVTLNCGGKQFTAHRAFLSVRSPVFMDLFESNLDKCSTIHHIVDIPDINADIMDDFLKFIYCGTAPNIKKFATELLEAADKYQINELKSVCEVALLNEITDDNVAKLAVLSEHCKTEQLQDRVEEFICANIRRLMTNPKFQEVMENAPVLFFRLIKQTFKHEFFTETK